jgi:hypothetical protein
MKIFHVEGAITVESHKVLKELLKSKGDARIFTWQVEQHGP